MVVMKEKRVRNGSSQIANAPGHMHARPPITPETPVPRSPTTHDGKRGEDVSEIDRCQRRVSVFLIGLSECYSMADNGLRGHLGRTVNRKHALSVRLMSHFSRYESASSSSAASDSKDASEGARAQVSLASFDLHSVLPRLTISAQSLQTGVSLSLCTTCMNAGHGL